jgi:hypothetical protein
MSDESDLSKMESKKNLKTTISKIIADEFKIKKNKISIILDSEKYGGLIIKAVPKLGNGSWDMLLNDYLICSYRGETNIPNDENIFLSNIFELEILEKFSFYLEYLEKSLQIEKLMIYKTDNSFQYNFNANVIQLYLDGIFNLIKSDFINLLANSDFEYEFKNEKYLVNTDFSFPFDLSKDDMIELIYDFFQKIDFNLGRIQLLDEFEKITGLIIFKYGKYRLVSDLSKFLEFDYEYKLPQYINYSKIFTSEYIVENLRDKNGLKFNIGQVRTAISRNHKKNQ